MKRTARRAAAAVLALGLAGCTSPGAGRTLTAGPRSVTAPRGLPVTRIIVNGNGGNQAYDGVGAILGGGGNARYLMDYPAPQRRQILDYLFKPGYGASLQLLKLEIGGGTDSSDGSEPSIEPIRNHIHCNAGYEFAIARQALALNPGIRLYGLQWSAPGWVGDSVFTQADIKYLLDWLGCAKRKGLPISYLGGWNEDDNGQHRTWWAALRADLNKAGYGGVKLVAGDSEWVYAKPDDPAIAILGAHDICEYPTGKTPAATCFGPKLPAKGPGSRKTVWGSELGGEDAGAQPGCEPPCAPGMVRALIRGYRDAKLTGYLEWPVLDAMPPGLPYENRGLVTADQPWSGSYRVNALTWATAQVTQFAQPQAPGHPGWKYIESGTGFLRGSPADGSYVSLVRSDKRAWSTIIETTGASAEQEATFTVTGGANGLAGDAVHVWASDFNLADPRHDIPSNWFRHSLDITPVRGRFTVVLQPGWVYSLTTTTGQGKGTAAGPAPTDFTLPYDRSGDLAGPGRAGSSDDEPQYLAAQDGSFELAPCTASVLGNSTCTEQATRATPVFWHGLKTQAARYPYAIIGDERLRNYTVSVETLLTQAGTSAGVIGRFGLRNFHAGYFDGYVFDVSAAGAWELIKNNASGNVTDLLSGALPKPLGTGTWHLLSMSLAGSTIRVSVDRHQVASYDDTTSPWTSGLAGIEAGAFTSTWPQAQYSNLVIR
jgi:hypothetical protein